MKRIFILILCIVISVSLLACGNPKAEQKQAQIEKYNNALIEYYELHLVGAELFNMVVEAFINQCYKVDEMGITLNSYIISQGRSLPNFDDLKDMEIEAFLKIENPPSGSEDSFEIAERMNKAYGPLLIAMTRAFEEAKVGQAFMFANIVSDYQLDYLDALLELGQYIIKNDIKSTASDSQEDEVNAVDDNTIDYDVKNVISLIDEIDKNLSLFTVFMSKDGEKILPGLIEPAKTAYADLSDEQKAAVTNYSVLEHALELKKKYNTGGGALGFAAWALDGAGLWTDEGSFVVSTSYGKDTDLDHLKRMNEILNFPNTVYSDMEATKSGDGLQRAYTDAFIVSWEHKDNGLFIIYELNWLNGQKIIP